VIVLDASALLAFLFRERGQEQVERVLATSCLSTVNLAEVLGRFTRDGHDAASSLQHLLSSPIEIVPFSANQAALAAALLPRTRPFGLSLGDRACLALGLYRNIPVMTADRTWKRIGLDLDVQVLR
jgi:PIN domain nuclease of toxin-antitoxin system